MNCVLCGIRSHDVSFGLIAWTNPVGSQRYTSGPRCKDVEACKFRVFEQGEEWGVDVSSWSPDPERKRIGDSLLGVALAVLVFLGSQP